ncbi:hypothetical protein [Streptomyces olivochromogenes]|uniref:hypothetical protein n=1 Tax=Streptomyces olivochromogenes TaxID=1963 RepID=UPI001F34BC04|nr:hypothetical protein [Streptomyces olivochromogenes]MCF3136041.1 hypothetical protein [Streptomyces olivochromogenes]
MRGLTDEEPTAAHGALQAAITAVAVLAALGLFMAACATGGTGARDEGPAHADAVAGAGADTDAGAAPSPAPNASDTYKRVDAVSLVKSDPKVSATVKRDLKPCVGDEYPLDVSYGDLTGGVAKDIVVNVLTCADAVGVGSYVYRAEDGRYENVFKAEESPVYAEIDRGDLMVTKQVYDKSDPVSNPSGENVITYSWSAGRFVQTAYHHTDYGSSVGGEPTPVPSDSAG